jgi:hypothetical protein
MHLNVSSEVKHTTVGELECPHVVVKRCPRRENTRLQYTELMTKCPLSHVTETMAILTYDGIIAIP